MNVTFRWQVIAHHFVDPATAAPCGFAPFSLRKTSTPHAEAMRSSFPFRVLACSAQDDAMGSAAPTRFGCNQKNGNRSVSRADQAKGKRPHSRMGICERFIFFAIRAYFLGPKRWFLERIPTRESASYSNPETATATRPCTVLKGTLASAPAP